MGALENVRGGMISRTSTCLAPNRLGVSQVEVSRFYFRQGRFCSPTFLAGAARRCGQLDEKSKAEKKKICCLETIEVCPKVLFNHLSVIRNILSEIQPTYITPFEDKKRNLTRYSVRRYISNTCHIGAFNVTLPTAR